MSLIDIGANLTHGVFADDLDQVLRDAQTRKIDKIIVTGATLQDSRDALQLAKTYPGRLLATAGIHPHHADETDDTSIEALRVLAQAPEIRAIGETGLDFFRDFSPRESQIKSFEAHIQLAIESGLPLFLHERDAFPTFRDLLAPHRDQLGNIVVHCFTGEAEALHAYIDLDCYIGITGWVCDERRGTHLLPLLKDIPDTRLLIETDSPYLMPRNISPKPKSRRNEPQFLTHVVQFLAEQMNDSYENIAARTTRNAMTFFNIHSSEEPL